MKIWSLRSPTLVGWGLGVLCGTLLAILGWWGLLRSAHNLPWSPDALYLEAWMERKREVAQKAPHPRIFFVGGSGVLYGISAGLLTESLGRSVVNFGIHAALPLDFLLEEVKRQALSGDTVMLILEYEYYNQDRSSLNDVSTKYLLAAEPQFLKTKPWKEKVKLALETPGASATAILWCSRREIESERNRIRQETKQLIDQYGDRTLEDRKELTLQQKKNLQAMTAGSLANSADDFSSPTTEIVEFVQWAHANDISVLAGFPCTIAFEAYNSELAKTRLASIRQMLVDLQVPVVIDAEGSLFSSEYFFDSPYHLNARGVEKRTEQVQESLEVNISQDTSS